MILRLVRGRIEEAEATDLFVQLRVAPMATSGPSEGRLAFVYGFRRFQEAIEFVVLSAWSDFGTLSVAVGGNLDQALSGLDERLRASVTTAHYELVDGTGVGPTELDPSFDAAVIGVVTGRIKANEESAVHALVRGVETEVRRAGVVALHIGRRVQGTHTDLVVLAVWKDRAALHRFAQQRSGPTIDPRFVERLEHFDFRTYDCVPLERLMVPPSGPAILLADTDRAYVDVSPGFEAVLGVPGELLLRQHVDDLSPEPLRSQVPELWERFLADGAMAGSYELRRLDGTTVNVRFRAAANVPAPGLHASIFDVPGVEPDTRPVAEIVAEAFPHLLAVPA